MRTPFFLHKYLILITVRTPFFLHKSDLLVCRVSSEPIERQGHERDATKRGVSLRRESVNELEKKRFLKNAFS